LQLLTQVRTSPISNIALSYRTKKK
jgi:hypothetical protein